jgi:voltage-gated potassium channel
LTEQTPEERWQHRTEWPLALVAVAFLMIYSVQVLGRPHGEEARILWVVSWIAWGLFVIDYCVRLGLATDRAKWIASHVFDLLIVVLPLMRPLRVVRMVILIGALQKAVGNAVRGRILIYTISAVALLIYAGSLAILDAERGLPGAKITTFGKAVWWAVNTVTTIGFDDLYPVGLTGRVIAVLLMIGGISLVGVVTASLASWIVQRVSETDSKHQAATAAHIDELRDEIRKLGVEMRELRTTAGEG